MTLKERLRAEPFTLALSSGYFGFFAHCGFARAFTEAGLAPARVTGSSAGAIVAASLAYGVDVAEVEKMVRGVRKNDFWDPGFGFGLLKGAKLEAMVGESLAGKTSRLPLAISVFDILARRTRSFDVGATGTVGESGATNPNGGAGKVRDPAYAARLVRASTAVPLMFHPVRIERRFFWDGGILDKMAIHGTKPDERVFVVYLPGRDPHSLYEKRRDLATAGPLRSVLVLKDLPQVGPDALDQGRRALDLAYEKTKRALDAEWMPVIEV